VQELLESDIDSFEIGEATVGCGFWRHGHDVTYGRFTYVK
jgi:hypothetical protein